MSSAGSVAAARLGGTLLEVDIHRLACGLFGDQRPPLNHSGVTDGPFNDSDVVVSSREPSEADGGGGHLGVGGGVGGGGVVGLLGLGLSNNVDRWIDSYFGKWVSVRLEYKRWIDSYFGKWVSVHLEYKRYIWI